MNKKAKNSPTYEISRMINDGVDCFKAENYRTAIRYFKEACEASRKIKIEYKECRALIHLADTYFRLEKYRKVIEYSEQSLKISREQGDAGMERESLINLNEAYEALGENDKATEYLLNSSHDKY